MLLNSIISDRWSPVAFSDKKIDYEVLMSLFEAAGCAPSAFNAQPWKFIWGMKGDDTYPLLFDLINEGNSRWAGTAPLLVLSITETVPPGRSSKNRFAHYDTGMAVGNILLQAGSLGLFVHQMGGYDHLRAGELFNLPATYEAMAMMAIGYKGDPGMLPDDIAARESKKKERLPLNHFVFKSKFAQEEEGDDK